MEFVFLVAVQFGSWVAMSSLYLWQATGLIMGWSFMFCDDGSGGGGVGSMCGRF